MSQIESASFTPAPRRPETAQLEHALQTLREPLPGAAGERERPPATILSRRPSGYASTFPLEELSVRMADGEVERLVFKDLSAGPTKSPWRVKAPFLRDPMREIEAYLAVLGPHHVTAPACRGAVVDPDAGRFWLFLERIDGVPLWQLGEPEVWRRAAEWLADLHARFAGRTQRLPRRLLRHDASYYRCWLGRTRRFVPWPERLSRSERGYDWLATRYRRAARWVAAQPPTFLHGEFYPSNVLVEDATGERRVRPVDWEMAGIGPGLLDLAALASGTWSEPEREALAEAYRAALPARLRPNAAELRAGLDRCRLLLAGQWLGWSNEWTPPPQHAHDWLATALELAGETP
jgi:aminoglycoside phosphotransferase (APT) family kinase protein